MSLLPVDVRMSKKVILPVIQSCARSFDEYFNLTTQNGTGVRRNWCEDVWPHCKTPCAMRSMILSQSRRIENSPILVKTFKHSTKSLSPLLPSLPSKLSHSRNSTPLLPSLPKSHPVSSNLTSHFISVSRTPQFCSKNQFVDSDIHRKYSKRSRNPYMNPSRRKIAKFPSRHQPDSWTGPKNVIHYQVGESKTIIYNNYEPHSRKTESRERHRKEYRFDNQFEGPGTRNYHNYDLHYENQHQSLKPNVRKGSRHKDHENTYQASKDDKVDYSKRDRTLPASGKNEHHMNTSMNSNDFYFDPAKIPGDFDYNQDIEEEDTYRLDQPKRGYMRGRLSALKTLSHNNEIFQNFINSDNRENLFDELANRRTHILQLNLNIKDELFLSKSLEILCEDLQPSQKKIQFVNRLYKQLERLLREKIEDCGLFLFGSYSNGLALDMESDVDLVLYFLDQGRNQQLAMQSRRQQRYYIQLIAKMLRKAKYPNVEPIQNARIPIVKFHSKNFEIQADISVNNLFPVCNSMLLRQYASFDPRVKKLLLLIKYWSKRRGIGDSFKGTMHSYAYYLLVIHYCQSLPEPLLPNLQDKSLYKQEDETLLNYNGTMYDCSFSEENDWKTKNKDSLGKILTNFFKFYGNYDFENRVISIRTVHPIYKEDKSWDTIQERFSNCICIEDPFILERNVCSLREEYFEGFIDELLRAYKMLCEGKPFDQICS